MAGADNESGHKPTGRDGETIRQRLDSLGEKLSKAKDRRGLSVAPPQSQGAALGQALRLGVELVAGVAVGGFIGWALDRLFGTAPFLMVAFLGLGAAAGIRNVVRTAQRMQANAPSGKDLPKVDDDDS